MTGIGPILIGASQQDCSAILGMPSRQFRRWGASDIVTLEFAGQCVDVTVTNQGLVVGICAFCPRQVLLNGIELLGKSLPETEAALQSAGIRVERIDVGLRCPDQGIALVMSSEDYVLAVEMWTEGY